MKLYKTANFMWILMIKQHKFKQKISVYGFVIQSSSLLK